jgi:hypothetical protein
MLRPVVLFATTTVGQFAARILGDLRVGAVSLGPARIRATSFDEPSAQTACRFVSASGRTPADETRCGAFCLVGLMLFYPFACRATACVPLKPDRSI